MSEPLTGQLLPPELIDRAEADRLDLELRQTRRTLAHAQATLRQTINGGALVHRVGTCIDKLLMGTEEQVVMGTPQQVPLDANRIAAIRYSMDGCLRMLDKLLPSLKAIEVQGDMPAGSLPAQSGGTVLRVVTAVPRDPNTPPEPISFA